MNTTVKDNSLSNCILSALPRDEYKHFYEQLEPVRFSPGEIISHAGDTIRYAYFFDGGQVSLLSITEEGATVEVGMVGNEGIVGVPAIFKIDTSPFQIMVQIPPESVMRLRLDILKKEFNRGGKFHDLLLRYTYLLLMQLTQSVTCNRFHSVEQRLCRWLLMASDITKQDTFYLTQESLGRMLGTPRTRVTMAAGSLQEEGLIRYSRGKISVANRKGLQQYCCECYRIVKEETDRYLQWLSDFPTSNTRSSV
jgi:CRP-like cAMP-binding protein